MFADLFLMKTFETIVTLKNVGKDDCNFSFLHPTIIVIFTSVEGFKVYFAL